MVQWIRSRLTYANVVSTVCLFVILGGTSYAVSTGSIDSREIKNNTVRGKDVRRGTLLSSDVRDRTLLARDFKAGQLAAGSRGPTGPAGVTGSTGATGQPGAPGAAGATNVVVRTAESTQGVTSGTFETAVANCQGAERATGGGFSVFNIMVTNTRFSHSRPSPDQDGVLPTGWSGSFLPTVDAASGYVRTYVVCASP